MNVLRSVHELERTIIVHVEDANKSKTTDGLIKFIKDLNVD